MTSSITEPFKIACLAGLDVECKIIIPEKVVTTFQTTCFRGKEKAYAGNSCLWNSPEEMLKDEVFLDPFGEIADEVVRQYWPLMLKGVRETVSIQLDPAVAVGWLLAAPRDKVNGAKLHPAKIGDRAQGMMVAVSDLKHPAPKTNLFHLELEFISDFKLMKLRRAGLAIRILGMGIGQDLGSLEGDLVHPFRMNGEYEARTMVFFSRQHIGSDELILLDP
jgi:hypothetical protein